MHSIRVDRINRLIEQRLAGRIDEAEIEAAGLAMRRTVRSLTDKPGTHLSLFDLSGLVGIDEPAVASAFRQWADPRFTCVRARKVALVAPSAMLRFKLEKPAAARTNMRVFEDRAVAMRWLFAA